MPAISKKSIRMVRSEINSDVEGEMDERML